MRRSRWRRSACASSGGAPDELELSPSHLKIVRGFDKCFARGGLGVGRVVRAISPRRKRGERAEAASPFRRHRRDRPEAAPPKGCCRSAPPPPVPPCWP